MPGLFNCFATKPLVLYYNRNPFGPKVCWLIMGLQLLTLPFGSEAVSYRTHMDQGLWICCFSTGFYFQQCLGPSAALTDHSQTQPAEERAHLVYASTSLCVMKDVRVGTLRILEAGAEAEAVEKGCLLACSACFLCTRDSTTHVDWTLPHHSSIRKMCYRLATGQSDELILSVDVS